MKERAEFLLSEAKQVLSEYVKKEFADGEAFNLIEIMGISSDEVKICRLLSEIIDPVGKHGKGTLFLNLFIKQVLAIDIDENELKTAKVYTEYHTCGDRRIDIAIITTRRFVPIEVKIYACDQRRQCKDYYDFELKQKKEFASKVFYLTLDGHLPRDIGSIGLTPIKDDDVTVGYEEIIPISFSKEICQWLNECLKEVELNSIVYTNLKQFKDSLTELCGNMDEDLTKEIAELTESNKENFKAACAISNSVQIAKENMIIRLLSTIKTKLESNSQLIPIENKYDFRHNDFESVKKYYISTRTKITPGFSYLYKKINRNKEIWLRVEIDRYSDLCFGFVVAEKGENPGELLLSKKEIENHLELYGFETDEWYFYWEYLLDDDREKTPDFSNNNDVLCRLFDTGYFEEFTDKCVEQIKRVVSAMQIK